MSIAQLPVPAEVLKLLARASTATLTTQLFKLGLRNTFLAGLTALNPRQASFVGEAFTLRYIPAREDIDVVEVFEDPDHPQRKAIESVGPGQVLVMDCRGELRAASAGQILVARMMRRGAKALVTDGALRDSPAIAQMPFPVFCAGSAASLNLARHHAVDVQVPVGCAGVPVYPGDIVVGDAEGVVCIPRHLAETVAAPAADQEALERFILARVEGGARLAGTYPPDRATLEAFRLWSRQPEGDGSGASAAAQSSTLDSADPAEAADRRLDLGAPPRAARR